MREGDSSWITVAGVLLKLDRVKTCTVVQKSVGNCEVQGRQCKFWLNRGFFLSVVSQWSVLYFGKLKNI